VALVAQRAHARSLVVVGVRSGVLLPRRRASASGGRFRETCATADVCDAALCRARTFFARAFFRGGPGPNGRRYVVVPLSGMLSGARFLLRALWELWLIPSPSPCPRRCSPPHPGLSFCGRGCRAGKRWAAAARATHGSKRVARARFSGDCRPSLVWGRLPPVVCVGRDRLSVVCEAAARCGVGGGRPSKVWAAPARRWCVRRPPVVVWAAAARRGCGRRLPVGGVCGGRPSVSGRRPPVGVCGRRPPVGVCGRRPLVAAVSCASCTAAVAGCRAWRV